MKISLNWLKKYVKIGISDEELVRLIGARLVEVEGVIDETHKYDNIYVARVASAEKIPETHLTLCQIDVGKVEVAKVDKNADGLVQVVCGAPNVREGMLAAWIAPGATVPASVHEDAPFVIGKRKMLGKYESNGMLAGADELDFGDDHSGIVEIDPEEAKPGDKLADVFELEDLVLDIENKSLTHRPDCFGIIGFAREVHGILGTGRQFELPDDAEPRLFAGSRPAGPSPRAAGANSRAAALRNPPRTTRARLINFKSEPKIHITSPEICQRYSAVVMEKHGEMRKKYLTWMDTVLSKSGMRPIDPIVDTTNYLMLLTGQPLHAFDYDKFIAVGGEMDANIEVRLAREGERLTLLDGEEIELRPSDIVICSGNVPVALAGAMGGESTKIDETTQRILIESATFSLYNLRKTQMEHGIFSEAITRFTKGQPDYQTLAVAEAAAEMLSSGFIVVAEADERTVKQKKSVVKITTEEINGLLGADYSEKSIIQTLTSVNFDVEKNKQGLTVTAPEWRTDIHIKEDIIEEIGRLNGYDNIKPVLPKHGTAERNLEFEFKKRTREILSTLGANEVLTYSFVSGKLLEKAGLDANNSYRIVNSISPELQYIRQSIVPSLLDKAYMNQKIPFDKFALFEMNKVYQKEWGMDSDSVPIEKNRLGFVITERKTTGAAYYAVKRYAEEFLTRNNIKARYLPIKNKAPEFLPYESKRAAEIVAENGTVLGVVGEFKNSVRRNFKLADFTAGFELDLNAVMACATDTRKVEVVLQHDKRDLTVKWDKNYEQLITAILKVLDEFKVTAKITPLAIYQPESDKYISVHLEFDQKVDEKLMQKLETL